MKIVSLVFNYDLEKQKQSGRLWGDKGYRSKEYIFEYSAASIATFLHHNPNLRYVVNTDDAVYLNDLIKKYKVNTKNLEIVDSSKEIEEWKKHKYCFNPAMMHYKEHMKSGEKVIKLDNDLTCLKPLTEEILNFNGALIWEKEFPISRGREYWGERKVAREVVGTEDFNSYNIGVFALSEKYVNLVDDMIDIAYKMLDVDISDIVFFKEDPAFKAKMWSCSEQTAYSYVIDRDKLPVREMNDFFMHHCYGFTAKDNCIKEAKYLLRENND